MRRLSILLLLIPFAVLLSCSSNSASATVTPVPLATATQSAPGSDATIGGTVKVDFTGAPKVLDPIQATFEVALGSTAWDAIKAALGEGNVTYKDYGGDLGIFVSGFKGVEAEGNHFWEFKINGESAQVGVAKYKVQQGDVIEFVYSSF